MGIEVEFNPDSLSEEECYNYFERLTQLYDKQGDEEIISDYLELRRRGIEFVNWDADHIALEVCGHLVVMNNPDTRKPLFEIKRNERINEIASCLRGFYLELRRDINYLEEVLTVY